MNPRSLLFSLLFVCLQFSAFAEDDVKCLQGLKESLTDQEAKLSSWRFTNITPGFICGFDGVTCWSDKENRLIGLELQKYNLAGTIPDSLQLCHSLQILNLAGNSLSGTIPSQICPWLPFLVTLDLSKNGLTGQIPDDLVNCSYLNNLILDDNKLSGMIPYQFSYLLRLKKFSAANNDLSGQVPSFSYKLELDLGGNRGLSGGNLGKCGGLSKKSWAIIIAAGVLGASASLLLGLAYSLKDRRR